MIPMRRRTSSAVIAAAPPPRASGCCRCAATGTVSTASSRFKRYRIPGGLREGDRKANAPDRGGPRPGALAGSLSVTACGVSAPARPAASPSGRRASARPAPGRALVVADGTGADARDARVGGLAVLEDEARLEPERPREHHACRTVGAIGVIVRIVVHDDPKTHATVVVRAPGGIVHRRVAVIAQEPRIIVVPLDVVRRQIVVPVAVPRRYDALRQVRDRHVRVAVYATVGNGAIVPMVVALERVVHERVTRDDGEDVAHARVVVDIEGDAGVAARDLVVAATAREVVLPRLARKQHPHPAIGVDAQDGDVRVLLGAKVHAHALAGCIGVLAPVGPDLDAWAVGPGGGADEQAEQPERGQHKCLPPPGRSRRHAIMRAQVPFPNRLSMATLQPRWTAVIAPPLSSTRDNRPIISFREPHG